MRIRFVGIRAFMFTIFIFVGVAGAGVLSFDTVEGPGGKIAPYMDYTLQTDMEWPAQRTDNFAKFDRLLSLLETEPKLKCSLPWSSFIEDIRQSDPTQLAKLSAAIAENRVELVGGQWCQADPMLLSEESVIRQFLYGQGVLRKTFGTTATVAFAPDTQGLPANYPQLLSQCGLNSLFITEPELPTGTFWWEGPNNSRILVINKSTRSDEDKQQRLTPKHVTAGELFSLTRLESSKLPVKHGALGDGPRGRLTTRARIKAAYRDTENKLLTGETLAAMASVSGFNYPKPLLRSLWLQLATQQHQDTLGGTCVADSFDYSLTSLNAVSKHAEWFARAALRHIGERVPNTGRGFGAVVANPLGYNRSGIARINLPVGASPQARYKVTSSRGNEVSWQVARTLDGFYFFFFAENVPAYGWDVYRIERLPDAEKPGPHKNPEGLDRAEARVENDGVYLENGYIRVRIEKQQGRIVSIYDKVKERELIAEGRSANHFEVFMEAPYEDYVDIASTINEIVEVVPVDDRHDTTITDLRPLMARVRLTWRFGESIIVQYITVTAGSPRIDFDTSVRWRQITGPSKRVPMLRVSFPLAVGSESTFQHSVPFGHEMGAKDGIDIPAVHWASLSSVDGGAALMCNRRYAFSATEDHQLRLTLLRSPYESGPTVEEYEHAVRYSLTPFAGPVNPVRLTREALAFHQPFATYELDRIDAAMSAKAKPRLPKRQGLFDLSELDTVVPLGLKRSEDGEGIVLRMFQGLDRHKIGILWANFPVDRAEYLNPLEESIKRAPGQEKNGQSGHPIGMRGHEILSLKFYPKNDSKN